MMKNTITRRLVTIPSFFLLTALFVALLPIWLPLSLIAALIFPKASAAPRCLLFITSFLVCEVLGLIAAFYLWLRYGAIWLNPKNEAYIEANYALQFWWANALKDLGVFFFSLKLEVEGEEALQGDGAIILPRHTSIADTVLPLVFCAKDVNRRVRYVIKRELELDPCLDIVGNRIPNYFIDRQSNKMSKELASLGALASSMGPQDGVLIYLEGTRFSEKKRQEVINSLRKRRDEKGLERAERWTEVLPPRSAGTLAILEANPGKDLIMFAHTGFEGSSHFSTLFSGAWVNTTAKLRFWRIPYSEIPETKEGKKEMLFNLWDDMNEAILEMNGDA